MLKDLVHSFTRLLFGGGCFLEVALELEADVIEELLEVEVFSEFFDFTEVAAAELDVVTVNDVEDVLPLNEEITLFTLDPSWAVDSTLDLVLDDEAFNGEIVTPLLDVEVVEVLDDASFGSVFITERDELVAGVDFTKFLLLSLF